MWYSNEAHARLAAVPAAVHSNRGSIYGLRSSEGVGCGNSSERAQERVPALLVRDECFTV